MSFQHNLRLNHHKILVLFVFFWSLASCTTYRIASLKEKTESQIFELTESLKVLERDFDDKSKMMTELSSSSSHLESQTVNEISDQWEKLKLKRSEIYNIKVKLQIEKNQLYDLKIESNVVHRGHQKYKNVRDHNEKLDALKESAKIYIRDYKQLSSQLSLLFNSAHIQIIDTYKFRRDTQVYVSQLDKWLRDQRLIVLDLEKAKPKNNADIIKLRNLLAEIKKEIDLFYQNEKILRDYFSESNRVLISPKSRGFDQVSLLKKSQSNIQSYAKEFSELLNSL